MSLHIPPSLKHRGFFSLWLGFLISLAGSQMQLAALHWHIRQITAEPIALGMIGAARIIPVILFSLIGGAVADAASRRKVLFITQTVMAATALALALLTFSGRIQLWHIYLLTAIQAMAQAFDGPARQAIVPNLVPARDLPNAFSMTSIASQVGSIVGPALSGFVIAGWDLGAVYLINAVSFGAVLLALVAIGAIPQQRLASGRIPVSWTAITDGLRFIFGKPIIFSTMIVDFVATFFASANTLLPIVAVDVLKVGAVEYGFLSGAQSVGAVLAGLIISQLPFVRRQGPRFIAAVMVFGLATVVFGLSRNLYLSILSLVVVGAADAVSTIIRNTIRQLATPDHLRGRMVSINQIFFMGGPQLGEVEAGVVAQLSTAPVAIISGGIATILAVALIIRRWPQLRAYTGEEAAAPA